MRDGSEDGPIEGDKLVNDDSCDNVHMELDKNHIVTNNDMSMDVNKQSRNNLV